MATEVTVLESGQSERLFSMKAGRVQLRPDLQVFISYQTIVGFQDKSSSPVFTSKWARSKTTTEHKGKFIKLFGGREVPEGQFSALCRGLGLTDAFGRAPKSFE